MNKSETYLKGGSEFEPETEEMKQERKEAEIKLTVENCSGLGECDDDIVSFGKSITSPDCPFHLSKIKALIDCYNKNHIFKLKTEMKKSFEETVEQYSFSRDMDKAIKWAMRKSDPKRKTGVFSSMKKKLLEKFRGKSEPNYRETIRANDPTYQNIEGVNDDLSPYEKTAGKRKSKKLYDKRTRKLARNGKRKSRKARKARRSRTSRRSRRN